MTSDLPYNVVRHAQQVAQSMDEISPTTMHLFRRIFEGETDVVHLPNKGGCEEHILAGTKQRGAASSFDYRVRDHPPNDPRPEDAKDRDAPCQHRVSPKCLLQARIEVL